MKNIFFLLLIIGVVRCGSKKAEYIERYDNGQVKLKGYKMNNKKSGTWVAYDEKGNKVRTFEYTDGEMKKRRLFVDEKLIAIEEMADTLKHGETVVYYSNGNVESITNFEFGIQRGEQLFYNETNSLISKYLIDPEGEITEFFEYYPNGQVAFYAPNLKNSTATVYDSLGNNTYNLIYRDMEVKDTIWLNQ